MAFPILLIISQFLILKEHQKEVQKELSPFQMQPCLQITSLREPLTWALCASGLGDKLQNCSEPGYLHFNLTLKHTACLLAQLCTRF